MPDSQSFFEEEFIPPRSFPAPLRGTGKDHSLNYWIKPRQAGIIRTAVLSYCTFGNGLDD